MTRSSEEKGLEPAIRKVVRAEVETLMAKGRATERVILKPGMKRLKKQTKKRAMERLIERVMKRVFKQQMKRVFKQQMERLISILSPEGAPADWNVNHGTSPNHRITRSEVREYHLLFGKKLHDTIFTKDKITDEDGGSIQIQLTDPISGQIIEKMGDLSSIEIEIVVLEGDFGSESHENWTEQEFNDKIVDQRKDKRSLVKGNRNIKLISGVGTIDDLSFSYISNSKKFRLGARVESNGIGQVRIKEAITEAFTVRHQRGKMKHLKKIQKGGKFHKALIKNNIRTASELKRMFKTNPNKLKKILKGCSKWEWEVIVHHASCVLDDAISSPSRSQEPEASNTATTGSAGIQDDNNCASSPQYLAENFQNLTQPPAMSTPPSHVNAQSTINNDNHQSLNINVEEYWSQLITDLPSNHRTEFSAEQHQQNTGMPFLNGRNPDEDDFSDSLLAFYNEDIYPKKV